MTVKKKIPDVNGNLPNPHENRTGPAPSQDMGIVIPRIQRKVIKVEIVGVTPLLVCNWSYKAIREMLGKQMRRAKSAKEAKDPQADYLASLYVSEDGWTGIPAGGMKACIVNAVRLVDGLEMTLVKRLIRVIADGTTQERVEPDGSFVPSKELVRIHGDHKMHRGMVRVGMGVADIRFRAIYPKWSIQLMIGFPANLISDEQVLNLLEYAGDGEGLCEHRPGSPKNHSGDFGRFEIKRGE